MTRIDAALAACRFLQDGSALLLWGGFAYLSMLVPAALADAIDRRLRLARNAAVIVAMAATAATLPLHAAAIGSGWADAVNPANLHAVLFETRLGSAWQAQTFAALVLIATLVLPLGIASRQRRLASAVASALLLATFTLTGHAMLQQGWQGAAHRINDAVHLLCGGAWLGALVPLLPTLAALKQPELHADAVTALRRFSTAGHAAVAGVIATGAVNTLLVLGRVPTDIASPYQLLLVCKLALVAGMAALAVFNRYGLVPQLKNRPVDAAHALRAATMAEIALGICVIALVAVFGMLEPA